MAIKDNFSNISSSSIITMDIIDNITLITNYFNLSTSEEGEELLIKEVSANVTTSRRTCTLFDQDGSEQWKCDTLITIRRISASLSIIGCLVIISITWLFRKYQSFVQRLLLYASISGILSSSAYLLGNNRSYDEDGPTCNFEAFWLTFTEWSLLLWTLCITYNILMNSVWMQQTEQNEWTYQIIGWALPFIIATLPLFGDNYGPDGGGAWCWIEKKNWDWKFGLWYAPFFVLFLFLFVVVIIVGAIIRKRERRWEGTYNPELERATKMTKECVRPLFYYPLIYMFTSVVPLINRIQDTLDPNSPPVFTVYILQCILGPLTGALNGIVFLTNRETRSRLTWLQIKAAWQRNTNHQIVIREYPIMLRLEDKVCKGESQVVQFLRYDRVEYQKLQGSACKSQSCIETE